MDTFGLIVIAVYVVCYFSFGLKGARRFINNKLPELAQNPEKSTQRKVATALLALVFAYIEFARIVIVGIIKVVRFIVSGGESF